MMEAMENRFAHLLKPIKELTKNWDIDLASELNDYIEELDEMCITFDGGKLQLNFAEAALLIQGSTCIYSKKVELLHRLVYQTLEHINDKNKKRNKQSSETEQGDAGEAENHDEEDVAEFSPFHLEASQSSLMSDSITTADLTPLLPESLNLPESHEKNKLPLISAKGEIACSQKDFVINRYIPRDDLILLTRRATASTDGLHQLQIPGIVESEVVGGTDDGGDDAADGFLPLEENNMEAEGEGGMEVEEHIDRQQAQNATGRMLRERRQVEAEERRPEAETAAAVNIWALHDPYAVIGEDKPLKSGKCYAVPKGLDDGGKRKRGKAAVQDFGSWFTETFNQTERKFKNGPTFTDLNYIYVDTLKDRLKTRRRLYRKAGVAISEEVLRETLLQPEEAEPEHCHLLGGDDDLSDTEQGAFPDDVPAEFLGGDDVASGGNGVALAEPLRDEMTYEDLVKLRVEQLAVNSRDYTQETRLSRRIKDWEDKIRPVLDLQAQRPPFDIHKYCQRIVDSLGAIGNRRSFASIVHGLDNYEASKNLLASLQLANDYTVEIDSAAGLEDSLEDSLDSMGLTLLNTIRTTDRFKTLQIS